MKDKKRASAIKNIDNDNMIKSNEIVKSVAREMKLSDKSRWFQIKLNKLVDVYAEFSGKSHRKIYDEIKQYVADREKILFIKDLVCDNTKNFTYDFSKEFDNKLYIKNFCEMTETAGYKILNPEDLKYDDKTHTIVGDVKLAPIITTIDINIDKDDKKDE